MRTELQVPSQLQFLTVVETWLLGSLALEFEEQVDWPRQANRLRLVLAEAYSNVVRHAHRDRPQVPVVMRLETKDLDMTLEIWDCGRGFDLATYLPPVPEAKQESGYGWLILNRLMDRVEYRVQAEGDRNCLSLVALMPPKPKAEDVA